MTSIREHVKAIEICQDINPSGKTHRKQKFTTEWRYEGNANHPKKNEIKCRAFVRLDDECGNRHDSFSITGETKYFDGHIWREDSGGCIHDEVAKFFPELAPFVKWHLTSTDGPMHYIANATYHASDKDGKYAKGEPCSWDERIQFGTFPVTFECKKNFREWLVQRIAHNHPTPKTDPSRMEWEPLAVEHKPDSTYAWNPQYTLKGYQCGWGSAPFSSLREAEEFIAALKAYPLSVVTVVTGYSKGKERNLVAARSCAVWPEASDEQLCSDNLKELLEARHAPLMAEFKEAMEELGFAVTEGERNV